MKQLSSFLEMIKFSHSIFAMPFALIAMIVAANGFPGWGIFFWILVAVISARTAAMSFNRIVDRDIDRDNPRTKSRALVTGELSVSYALAWLLVSVVVFYLAAGMLNQLALWLATPCLAILLGYSVLKRVTPFVHGVLGLALGLAPIGAWVAVTGELAWTPIVLAMAVLMWVMGFDLLYACQDYEADLKDPRVHSIPKKIGKQGAFKLAGILHALCVLVFTIFWFIAPQLSLFFILGILATGGLLIYQHSIISPKDLLRINAAFFTANGIISVMLLGCTLLDFWLFR